MANFRKRIDPNYKATRKEPTIQRKVNILWERIRGGAVGAIVDVGTGWDMFVSKIEMEGKHHQDLAAHVVTAGLISLAEHYGYTVVQVLERHPPQAEEGEGYYKFEVE